MDDDVVWFSIIYLLWSIAEARAIYGFDGLFFNQERYKENISKSTYRHHFPLWVNVLSTFLASILYVLFWIGMTYLMITNYGNFGILMTGIGNILAIVLFIRMR